MEETDNQHMSLPFHETNTHPLPPPPTTTISPSSTAVPPTSNRDSGIINGNSDSHDHGHLGLPSKKFGSYGRRISDATSHALSKRGMSKCLFVDWFGEYIGTTMYLFFAFSGTIVASSPSPTSTPPSTPSQYLYTALSFGLSLLVNIWIFFRVSGGFFNPAVTFGFYLAGKLPRHKALIHFVAQMLGGITAAAIVSALLPEPLNVDTRPSHGTSKSQAVFIEMFLTAELVFTVFMLAAEKHKATFLAPVGIGLVFFVIELVGVYFTGGSANPARSFGPAVANRKFPNTHWIYWVGPALGSVLAVIVYKGVKMLEYEKANPGQDAGPVGVLCDKCKTQITNYPGAPSSTQQSQFQYQDRLEQQAGMCTIERGADGRPECGMGV